MKAARGSLVGALDRPNPALRFYLFHGPDESQSRGHGERLLEALAAEKFVVPAGAAKSDPALLADEAGAMSLFGGKRAIWVEPAGDEIAAAVDALLDGAAPESVVIAIAGTLRKTSALLKRVETSPAALAHASYPLEGGDAEAMVTALARGEGLRIDRSIAARLAAACGNDRGIVAQEVRKLALYVGASPEKPRELAHDDLDAVGADMAEGDLLRLADMALGGDAERLGDELARLPPGAEPIVVIRALQRRLHMLAPLRARVEAGQRAGDVMKSMGKALFFKDEPIVRDLLGRWDSARLATVAERAGKLERRLMARTPPPALEALGEELLAIARVAARRR